MRFTAVVLLLALVRPVGADDYVPAPDKTTHWAWKAPVRPPFPTVVAKSWVRNAIDPFILARLEAIGIQPAGPATRAQLLRRVTFDLIGLPPTPAEIDAFVGDSSPGAWERVIDRLLASPHYGERWGRHWLDLVRFAESNGYEFDEVRPDAWRYRDYVIDAFNTDKPYDRFLLEQVAGDELFPHDVQSLIATGFNLLGPDMTDASNQLQRRQNTLDDMTDTTGLVFLGLTIGCARCHDHKFEPIPQTDFYRLQAFFAPATFRKDLAIGTIADKEKHGRAEETYRTLIKPLSDELARLEEPHRHKLFERKLAQLSVAAQEAHRTPKEKRTPVQKGLVIDTLPLVTVQAREINTAMSAAEKQRAKELQAELKKFDAKKPGPMPVAAGIVDGNKLARTVLLRRGELNNPGEEVTPGFPIIVSPGFEAKPAVVTPPTAQSTGRRSALARWLTSNNNPLTARVMVNRLWQHHFGRGLVATPNDFGVRGAKPTHPELLDWLAKEFIETGWRIKPLHKLMLLSATYQQATEASKDALIKDADNLLFSRMNRLRLEGEVIRDSLLAVGSQLNPKMGGPSVFPPLPPEVAVRDWKVTMDPAERVRRSVYIFAKRNLRFPFLESFDLPDSNQSCPKRERSTTAPQALALLNAKDVAAAAQALATRVAKEATARDEQIRLVFRLTVARSPSSTDLTLAREFLNESPLTEFCRTMFNINEFVYLD